MKKLLRKWLVSILGQPNIVIKGNNESCSIVYDGRHFLLTMPNGEIIPQQIKLTLEDNFPGYNSVTAKITLNIVLTDEEYRLWESLHNL